MQLPPLDILSVRAERLADALTAQQLDALVVTSLPNIAYLTGFFASAAALIVTSETLLLMSDARYSTAVDARAREWPRIRAIHLSPGESYDQAIVDALGPFRGLRIGFEASQLTVRRHTFITNGLAARGWETELRATDGVVEGLRVRKDSWEIGRLRDGAERLSRVAKCILPSVLAGRTESHLAAEIEIRLRHIGFERPSFDTIVAAGPNAALPHARASSRVIEDGELVVLDFGGVLDGYCTDLTRTVTAGSAGPRERRLIEQVVEAQVAAFRAVGSGRQPEAVDAAAREVLAGHGLADAFTHGTGHGLGLEVHEAPRVTRARPDHAEPPLASGMVITLEPGVYFSGWGGVRIEDDVLVTGGGAEWLTDVPRIV
jgi:Xaa-Pro aminopeptidase